MSKSTNSQISVPAKAAEELIATSFLMPEGLWKRVKNLATERRVSAASLWCEAMKAYLKQI